MALVVGGGLDVGGPGGSSHGARHREIDYADAAELAYYGARVLHLKMIAPLQRARIPLRVKSIHQPEAAGTHIHSAPDSLTTVLGVTSLPGVALRPADEGERSTGRRRASNRGRIHVICFAIWKEWRHVPWGMWS